ncbi:hypothetical protein EVU96_15705 [Bacillus infantis]|uniref:hypothetical protein n=1 Tax=Bacillus infantis TaxID=324767 RepID=UPI00101CD1CA|nr:hypothetical protein [Bacillus infantis]RYI27901.1 hypothetical protein EVU96_15705 [Bacillus infantis]
MKKTWKVIFSVFLVLVIGAAGTLFYFFKVKTYDVADEEIEELTESEYDIVLPGEEENPDPEEAAAGIEDGNSSVTADGDGQAEGTGQAERGSQTAGASSQTTGQSGAASGETDKGAAAHSEKEDNPDAADNHEPEQKKESEVTVAGIKEKFRPSFENLQSQADSKINAIAGRAYSEYQEKKSNGESISFSYFYQKYSSAAEVLESKTDSAFSTIYSALEKDLKKNGFSASHAKSFEEEYESAKKSRETALLRKAKEAL